jgi:cysteine desulfurase
VRTYLDHNATSPLRPSVKAAMVAAMDVGGNASSIHREGRAAHKVLDDAREALAVKLGCLPQMIVFTSGGTEANTLALRGVEAQRIVVSAVEHPSVLSCATDVVPVDVCGRIDLSALEKSVHGANVLVSVMLANNETGVVQLIADVARIVHGAGGLLHVDAVQAFGKMPVNFGLLGCDMLTVAAHKVGGPKGVGALVVRDGLVVEPLLAGGGQELRRRAGTENIVAIVGFGAVAQEPLVETQGLTDQLVAGLGEAIVFGDRVARLSNTTSFALPGGVAETMLMNLDLDGVAVSSGSACSSGKVGRSHVLDAMGITPELSQGALRISLGWDTTRADIERFLNIWTRLVVRHKSRRAA